MIKKSSILTRSVLACVALVGALVVTVMARPAFASAGASGAITQVEYLAANPSNPQLLVQLNGNSSVNYTAQQTSPGCGVPALSADSLKILLSQAQAVLLAAKNATIYYNTCGSTNYIYDIVMPR